MILSDIKNDNCYFDCIKEIKIIYENEKYHADIIHNITNIDIGLDVVESGWINFSSIMLNKSVHDHYDRKDKIKRIVIKFDVVDAVDTTQKHSLEIIYDCKARIRKLQIEYDCEFGENKMVVSIEGEIRG